MECGHVTTCFVPLPANFSPRLEHRPNWSTPKQGDMRAKRRDIRAKQRNIPPSRGTYMV
jgi:hypothetical protein